MYGMLHFASPVAFGSAFYCLMVKFQYDNTTIRQFNKYPKSKEQTEGTTLDLP